jgi:hypothetical protein
MPKEYVEHSRKKIGNRTRVLYKKKNSRSDNPVLYIIQNEDYLTYKSFFKKNKKMKGGKDELDENGNPKTESKNVDLTDEERDAIIRNVTEVMNQMPASDLLTIKYELHNQDEKKDTSGGRPKPKRKYKKFINPNTNYTRT